MLATRMIDLHRVFLYTTFQRMLLYAKMEAFPSSSERRFYSLKSPALCSVVSVSTSKTAVTNTYHWSNQGNFDCR